MTTRHFTEARHDEGEAYGPFSFLNPTKRKYTLSLNKSETPSQAESSQDSTDKDTSSGEAETRASEVQRDWRSRDNRKGPLHVNVLKNIKISWTITKIILLLLGRHAISITPEIDSNAKYLTPPRTSSLRETVRGIGRMFTAYPYYDVSYLVAVVFTFGSVVWVVNAFFVWLPLQSPGTEFNNEISSGGGITAFIGATIFEFGSVLLMIEAVNENRADCFGWALEEALEENGLMRLKPDGCTHHHRNHRNLVGKGKAIEGKPSLDSTMAPKDQPQSSSAKTWTWFPTWHELTTHYFKEVGFLACLAQMFGATVFWISGFTALPPIYNALTSNAALNGAYWAPQVIGGSGFIISGTLFMLETQQKWYLPAPHVLGWHIGAWNLVGGIGFTLCGALGFASANSGAVYEGSLATFWGSWCFLIGSAIQWFESLDKHPVEVEKGGGRVADTKAVA
ncbi:hypothetical protein B7494_g6681 [Chlorociboria aeruginascens]|nr:hypothetical protein B7494_g6681 [Chlorociboria aeruginascens]